MRGRGASARAATRAWLVGLLVVASVLVRPPVAAAAADDGLRLQVDATYTVVPDDRVVRVVLDVTATNETPGGREGDEIVDYYFDEIILGLPEEAVALRARAGQQELRTTLEPDEGYQLLTVRLPRNLLFRQTQELRVVFDLPGGEPRSSSAIRVGQAFASFYAWAYGDPAIGDVRIVFPAGFDPTTSGSDVRRGVEEGRWVLQASDVADTDEWYLQVDAGRDASLTAERLDLGGGQRIRIRAWPEDEEWQTRVSAALADGLPELSALVGLPWPVEGELDVVEVHTPLLEGYAGIFDIVEEEIQVGEDLDEHTILHEAAHAWFNDELWSERWIFEGFADEYGALALEAIEGQTVHPDPVERDGDAAVPLNDWTWPEAIDDDAADDAEHYGYHASWRVLRELVGEIGVDRMREVLQAADGDEIAYVGQPAPEAWERDDDWRRFLDLLEERGGSEDAERIFREWVVEDAEVGVLDERRDARDAYAELLEAGDGWLAPLAVRAPLADWRFDEFERAAAGASDVLEARDALAAEADALGLEPPPSLESAYESAERWFEDAEVLVARQQASLDAIEAATASLGAARDPILSLGLWDVRPEQDLAEARVAWEADELDRARSEAEAVGATLTGAAEVGRTRALIGAVVAAGVVLLLVVLLLVGRRSLRRRRAARPAAYATLPADSPGGTAPAPDRRQQGSDEPA